MTNREKLIEVLKETFGDNIIDFKEVSGYTRDCVMLKCAMNCSECHLGNFWNHEYRGKEEGGNGK